jgi:hypothetical protein
MKVERMKKMRECFSNIKDAVMYKLENLAAFSYKNVPKCNPDLTAEDAIDVESDTF